jgi:hypothetical protein
MQRFWFVAGSLILGIILSACGSNATPTPYRPGTTTPSATITPASLTPITRNDDDAIVAAAKQIVIAELSIHYNDLNGWQTRLYPLCTDNGKSFWNTNVQSGILSGVVAQQRVTQAVVIERAIVEQTIAQGNQRAAFVAVSGQVTYQDKTGKHTAPFAQRMMLVLTTDATSAWKFVTLLGQ